MKALAKEFKEFISKGDVMSMAVGIIIGEGKTKTILKIMGRNPYYSMYDDIFELLEQVTPLLENGYKDFEKRVKEKYTIKKEDNILE